MRTSVGITCIEAYRSFSLLSVGVVSFVISDQIIFLTFASFSFVAFLGTAPVRMVWEMNKTFNIR